MKSRLTAGLVLAVVCALGAQTTGAGAAARRTGFTEPYAGALRYEPLAPLRINGPSQLHQPLGQRAADRIAGKLGLARRDAFTKRQYRLFITGRGVGGNKRAARILDRSIKIFISTFGHPLYSDEDGRRTRSVLASYGLFVKHNGLLESLANTHAPTRKANAYIEPGGYLETWCRANGATRTLRALYHSGYTVEAGFGFKSQQISGTAQLVPNTLGGVTTHVGMSMAPTIWLVNFALLYVLKPSLAAAMPNAWAPIPRTVVRALRSSPTGEVPYGTYASLLP